MASSDALMQPQLTREPLFTVGRRRQLLRVFAVVVMVIYTLLTLFPFYALFVRSFVPTKESADLHLWLPEVEEVSLSAEVGNLAVFYDLDLTDMKETLGIPYLPKAKEKRTPVLIACQNMTGKIEAVYLSFADWKKEDYRINEIQVNFSLGYDE